MTETNHSAENALAERVNGILEQEYELDADLVGGAAARRATERAIGIYNTRRPHTALGMATPAAVHAAAG
jgi:transposase InsO family protein